MAERKKADGNEYTNIGKDLLTTKARYWTVIMYLENMVDNWQEDIGDILQLPYAYCIHDKDLDKDGDCRKAHVHLLVAYTNTTTGKAVLEIFKLLNKNGAKAFNTFQKVQNIRHVYNYLIHDTEDSRKKGKYQYSVQERILGNSFDIGAYEQLGTAEKNAMRRELVHMIYAEGITNFSDFVMCILSNYDDEYEALVSVNSGYFERIIKGNYHKSQVMTVAEHNDIVNKLREELERGGHE